MNYQSKESCQNIEDVTDGADGQPRCAVASGSTFLRWADYDPSYTGNNRLSIYATKADQRGNRPDLKPLKVRVTIL